MQDVSFWSHGPFSPVKGRQDVVFIHRSQTCRNNSILWHIQYRDGLCWSELSNASYQISIWSKPNPASITFCPVSISYMSYEKLFSSNLNIPDLTREAKIVWKQPGVRAVGTLLRGKNSFWYLHQMFPTEDKKQASSLSQRKQLLRMTGKYGSPLFYCLGLWRATCFKADTLDSQLYSSVKF